MYSGFSLELLQQILCPIDAGALVLEGALQDPVLNGCARCVRCGLLYRVESGILILLEHQQKLMDPESVREAEARDVDAENYHTYCSEVGDRKEIPPTLCMLGELEGKRVLELGCGTGRYSVYLAGRSASFTGVDFSLDSLKLLAAAMPQGGRRGLVLADATKFQTSPHSFDLVLCAQVLQHVPTAALREDLYRHVAQQLTPGGVFVCNAYHHHLSWRMQGLPKEGRHESGIFYHRFTRKELTEEIGRHLIVRKSHPISVHIPFSGRLGLNDLWLSRVVERVPLLNNLGELMLVKAKKGEVAADGETTFSEEV
ncbi:methyltransferase domain-containing protein [Geomonas sp. RF6]|uniref:class I SAM-dependent methyltransferase n=1 Tax=Geomonas sp. RF6 TaxID=2897342 RepID=UPI001E65BC3E|nr:class I SAM-dependent methyltransferase [Geomonas sp. RF6]UFS69133.1 methyltransferase domain-containing protein [Geomonas sp. RF6]